MMSLKCLNSTKIRRRLCFSVIATTKQNPSVPNHYHHYLTAHDMTLILRKFQKLIRYFRNLMRNIRENTHLNRCVPGHTSFKWESTPHMKTLQRNHFFEDVIVTNLRPQMLRQRKNVHLQLVFLQVGESVFILNTLINLVSCTHYLKVVQLQRNNTMIYRVLFLLIWSNCNCWHAETVSIMTVIEQLRSHWKFI